MSYKYAIRYCKEGYSFHLLPNNSNTQDIGRSKLFQTEKACREALARFREYGAIFRNTPSLYEIEKKDKLFYFYFHYEGEKQFFYRKKGYYQKTNCRNGIEAVIKNIDAPLKIIETDE